MRSRPASRRAAAAAHAALGAWLLVGEMAVGQLPRTSDDGGFPPGEPVAQPVVFSHKTHTARGVKCAVCHALRDPGKAAGFPTEALCMSCHETVKPESAAIRRVAEHARSGQAIAWTRVYKLPDYVWFSHRVHHEQSSIACDTCHGAVAARDVLAREKSISMQSCMACHARSGASNACGFCHNPN